MLIRCHCMPWSANLLEGDSGSSAEDQGMAIHIRFG